MLTQMPSSDHTREDIHEQSDRDEASLEADVGNIADPDLIASTDLKVFEAIHPRTRSVNGGRGLTDTFHRYRHVQSFHQAGNTFIPNGVSPTQNHLCDTPISVCRIPQCQRLYFIPQDDFTGGLFRVIVESASGETERLTYLSHGIIRPQDRNYFSLLRQVWFNNVDAFFSMSSATVNLPTSCSRCAIRSAASLECLSVEVNREPTFSMTCCFHFETWSSLRLWRRHTSACEVSPRRPQGQLSL